MDVAVVFAQLKIPLDQMVLAMQKVGVQRMEVDRMNKATHMDVSTLAVDFPTIAYANVNNHSSCLRTFFDSIQVIKSPPGCVIQVGDGEPL